VVAAGVDLALAWSVSLTVASIVALEAGGLVFPDASLGSMLGYAALLTACLLLGRNRRGFQVQAEQAAALLAQQQRLQAEQRRGDVLDERARIAREIHDVLAHSLGALGIQIQAARAVLTDHQDIDRALEVLGTAQRMASDGLVETRRAVQALRADTLSLHEELARLTGTHRQRYHVPVSYEVAGEPAALPPDVTLALLRTAQEALVNAAKHAAGEEVRVGLEYGDGDVRLTVTSGMPAGAVTPAVATVDGGYGLTGMRERLRLLNGTLQAGPRDNQWVVIAELPLAAVAVQATP
jgi:signal transduction histidine kinase